MGGREEWSERGTEGGRKAGEDHGKLEEDDNEGLLRQYRCKSGGN